MTLASDLERLLDRLEPQDDAARDHVDDPGVLAFLATHLYQGLHTLAPPPRDEQAAWYRSATGGLLAHLEDVAKGRSRWEHGWTLVGEDAGRRVVERNGLRLWAAPEHVRVADGARGGGGGAPGDDVVVEVPSERRNLFNGYYGVLGPQHPEEEGQDCRLYFNVGLAEAPRLARELVSRMFECGAPFAFKILDDAALFGRTDAAVLYFERADRTMATEVAREVLVGGGVELRPHVSRLAFSPAPGVGYAECTRTESFGMERSLILARGLVHALPATPAVAAAAAVAALSEEGIDPARPYLVEASLDDAVEDILRSAWAS
jgi:hypothetical protein